MVLSLPGYWNPLRFIVTVNGEMMISEDVSKDLYLNPIGLSFLPKVRSYGTTE